MKKNSNEPPFKIAATSDSGLPVSFESINQAVATIIDSTVTITGAGETEIIATQTGNDEFYEADPVSRILVVNLILSTESDETLLSVHPNPTTRELKLSSHVPIRLSEIFGLDGKSFGQHAHSDKELSLDVTSLPGRLYVLEITDETGKKRKAKIVKR